MALKMIMENCLKFWINNFCQYRSLCKKSLFIPLWCNFLQTFHGKCHEFSLKVYSLDEREGSHVFKSSAWEKGTIVKKHNYKINFVKIKKDESILFRKWLTDFVINVSRKMLYWHKCEIKLQWNICWIYPQP